MKSTEYFMNNENDTEMAFNISDIVMLRLAKVDWKDGFVLLEYDFDVRLPHPDALAILERGLADWNEALENADKCQLVVYFSDTTTCLLSAA